jgi:hypothetical protein
MFQAKPLIEKGDLMVQDSPDGKQFRNGRKILLKRLGVSNRQDVSGHPCGSKRTVFE